MPARHPAALPDDALLRDCELTRTRASGPGGQRRNKVETAVVLRHVPTGLTARATEDRLGATNRRVALRRLRLALAVVERRPFGGPSALWNARASGGRIAVNPAHGDVAALVAEALDALAAHDWDGTAAAAVLGVSQSQIVRLLAIHHPALERWNAERVARGLRRLRGP